MSSRRLDSKVIICPLCGMPMTYDARMEFWACPGCKAELWPEVDFEKPSRGEMGRQARECFYESLKVPRTKKGGGSRVKRKHKKPLKRRPPWELV